MTFAAAYLAAHPIQCPTCGSNRVSKTVISTAFARQVHETKVGGASFGQIASQQKVYAIFPSSNPIVAFPSFGHCLRFPLIVSGHTFFIAKHGRDADGKQGFTAVFTMMNQLNEKEIEMLKARLGDIDGIWIGNPDSDEAFLVEKCMPLRSLFTTVANAFFSLDQDDVDAL
ncbi:hypothetical protein SPRG_01293 [Saprolegnia parasitica CBS 223.65]|uniref:Uncharacterized protein n=1 Tax=Saprolegnia parasitica (strain CBS 223.65) TaxID=695850 RepID=A0A067CTI5_SAPPC|nr:hypothetical protein SPRG_01293 [Saprolegnia parasitica CBS 223.65]KDO34019.1 hypothetical protein SPRG_01293 [Saprolegnia parasitica CBS 223.65]|eukprot:XP_012194904.1 hypothetical protein SPRG_01293 [Saprolegnia parasitica CBS 223.65]